MLMNCSHKSRVGAREATQWVCPRIHICSLWAGHCYEIVMSQEALPLESHFSKRCTDFLLGHTEHFDETLHVV
jgi:hypothetical protein